MSSLTLASKLGRPAKIGMISSWGQVCGIAQYTENLVAALKSLGHEVQVIANKPYEPITHPDEPYVHRLWEVEGRTGKKHFDYDQAFAILKQCDITHVQSESALYAQTYLPTLQSGLPSTRFVATHHSTCAARMLPSVRMHIAHEERVLDALGIPQGHRASIPMPSPVIKYAEPPVLGDTLLIRSYGLGRNQDDMVNEAVKHWNSRGINPKIRFETNYGHRKWLPFPELLKWIQGAHACILYYPPVGAFVTSSAAYLALACGRPLIVSDTSWFSSLSAKHAIFAGRSPNELNGGIVRLVDGYSDHVIAAKEYASWLDKHRSYMAAAQFTEQVYIEALS
jgi:hypothetical protein